jgi:hypothetical protein
VDFKCVNMIQGTAKTEAEYRAIVMDSSSSLKEFSMDRRKYYKKYYLGEKQEEEDNKAATIGRVVETLLLEPHEFDKRFYMSGVAKVPTGKMLDFVNALCRLSLQNEGKQTFEEMATQARTIAEFDWKLPVILGKFIGSDAEIYFKEIKEVRSKNLTVVTADDVENAERIVQELKSNEFTAELCNLETDERYLVQNQVQVEDYEVDGLKLKSMMDKVIVDHTKKTIQCIDLKCVWAVENFYEEYYLYRRAYIQAYLYKQACYELKDQLELEYYEVLNPMFLVCDSINYYQPLIYTLDAEDMNNAYNGFEHKSKVYPGVKQIIADLKWARENNIWTISRTNMLNGGYVNIKN